MAGAILIISTLCLVIGLGICYRLHLILSRKKRKADPNQKHPKRGQSTHLLVVLGSGGHTAEMIAMLQRAVNETDASQRLNWTDFAHRTWIVGSKDAISAQRAKEFEEMSIRVSAEHHQDKDGDETSFQPGTSVIATVPRAREIHQPLLTTPISALRCLGACMVILLQHANSARGFPDVILCNGPATAAILILASILLRFFNVGGCESKGKMRTVYVESWARVNRLSLSGRLLLRVVDRFIVQWPQLEVASGGKAEFLGALV